MPGLFVFLLVIIPALEIYLFIEIGGAIGAGWTFVLIIATALWGISALRRQGLAVLAEAQKAQARGQVPVAALAHGVLILFGGGLLLLPGFFTDMLGLVLMLRWGRLLAIETVLSALLPALMRGFQMRGAPPASPSDTARSPKPTIIEGDFSVNDENEK